MSERICIRWEGIIWRAALLGGSLQCTGSTWHPWMHRHSYSSLEPAGVAALVTSVLLLLQLLATLYYVTGRLLGPSKLWATGEVLHWCLQWWQHLGHTETYCTFGVKLLHVTLTRMLSHTVWHSKKIKTFWWHLLEYLSCIWDTFWSLYAITLFGVYHTTLEFSGVLERSESQSLYKIITLLCYDSCTFWGRLVSSVVAC